MPVQRVDAVLIILSGMLTVGGGRLRSIVAASSPCPLNGTYVKRKHSRIDLYRSRNLMPSQRRDNFKRLAVIEYVYDVGLPESMQRHRDRKMHPVIVCPLCGGHAPLRHGGSKVRAGASESAVTRSGEFCSTGGFHISCDFHAALSVHTYRYFLVPRRREPDQ